MHLFTSFLTPPANGIADDVYEAITCRIIAAGMNDKRDVEVLYALKLRGIAV